jgi:diguanylate cyclase (GGDEF)-like protein
VAALFLGLDRVKTVNDYLGHAAGDQFIQVFAQRLRSACLGDSVIARLGGDEIVIVPPDPMSPTVDTLKIEAAAQVLMDHQCYRGQGFLYSPPVTGGTMRRLLSSSALSR